MKQSIFVISLYALLLHSCKTTQNDSEVKKDIAIQNYMSQADRAKTKRFIKIINEIRSEGSRELDSAFLFTFFPLSDAQMDEINRKHPKKLLIKCEGRYCYGSSKGRKTNKLKLDRFKKIPVLGKPTITLASELVIVTKIIDEENTLEVCAVEGVGVNAGLTLYGAKVDARASETTFLDVSYASFTGSFPRRDCKPYIQKAKNLRESYYVKLAKKKREQSAKEREERRKKRRENMIKSGLYSEEELANLLLDERGHTNPIEKEKNLKDILNSDHMHLFNNSAIRCHQQQGQFDAYEGFDKYQFPALEDGFKDPGFYRMGPHGTGKALYLEALDKLRCELNKSKK